MRAALIAAARRLFVEKGYAETTTPEIVAAANVTRGALYHHFADKSDLFFAVVQQAATEVADEVEGRSGKTRLPVESLMNGADAFFKAMSEQGRSRLILIEAPAALTPEQYLEISDMTGAAELREGLEAALSGRRKGKLPIAALTDMLSAAFDRAALAIARGEDAKPYKAAIKFILQSLAGESEQSR